MIPTTTNLKPEQVQEQLSAEQLQLRDLLSPVLNPNQEIGLMCGCLAVFTLPEPPTESDDLLDHAPSYFELEGPATDPQMAYELTLTAAEYWQAQAGRMPLQELRALLRAVFLGAEGQDVAREAGRLFDALASVPLLPAPAASGGAGEVVRNDTPERSYRQELASADGQVYASIEVEADAEGHPVPVGLTVHRGVLLEAYGEDEADVVLALSRAEARALAGGLAAAAGVENL